MKLTKENIKKYIIEYKVRVEQFVQDEEFDYNKFDNLISDYDNITSFLVSQKTTPKSVIDYITEETDKSDITLPKEFEPIKSYLVLKEYVSEYCKKKLKDYLKKEDYFSVQKILVLAVKADIKNIIMFNTIEKLYKENNLTSDLIELYKLSFVYSSDTKYFEKIGDVFYDCEDYESALDAYLNYAEMSEEKVEIYEKLADVFGKINDNDSRLACLEHIKVIKGNKDV